MTSSQGSLQLASASEIAAAQAQLESQGYTTSIHTSSCAAFQYILSSYEEPNSCTGAGAYLAAANSNSGSGQSMIAEVVVPVSSRHSKLSMSLMMQLMDGVAMSMPTAAAAYSNTVHPDDAVAEADAASAAPRPSIGGGATTDSSKQYSISLAIVSGANVVHVKLFDGIQPPSESYG